MDRGANTWLDRAGIGCLGLIAGGTLVAAITWITMMSLTNQAVDTRRALDDAYPSQETFTPSLAGDIPTHRLERFLAIRRGLLPYCETLTAHQDVFRTMEGYDEAEEEPPVREFASTLGAVGSSLWRVGRDVGEFAVARNRILLENEMGLGEYAWIYVVAYYAWLGKEPIDFVAQGKARTKVFHGRVLNEIKRMIQRHIEELEAAEGTSPPPQLAFWRAELEALHRDEARVPFQDGLPHELEASLEPFRDRLEDAYCRASGELEIMQTVKTGLWYDHR